MNKTEFILIKQSYGLVVNDFVNHCHVSSQSVVDWRAEKYKVPQKVIDWLDKLSFFEQKVAGIADSMVTEAKNKPLEFSKPNIAILIYPDDKVFWEFNPDMSFVPAKTHAIFMARLARDIKNYYDSSIVIFDKKSYLKWLGDKEDSQGLRSAWAGEQVR